jgi:hypothetical protein
MHFHVTVVGEHDENDLARFEPGGTEEGPVDYFDPAHGDFIVLGGVERWADSGHFCLYARLVQVARGKVIPGIMGAGSNDEALKLYDAISELVYRSAPLSQARVGEIDWAAMKRREEQVVQAELRENMELVERLAGAEGSLELAAMLEELMGRKVGESDAALMARRGWFATTMILDLRGGVGVWYSMAEGLCGGSVDQAEWERSAHEFCAGLDTETLLTVYHCHA